MCCPAKTNLQLNNLIKVMTNTKGSVFNHNLQSTSHVLASLLRISHTVASKQSNLVNCCAQKTLENVK